MKIALPTRDGHIDDHFGHCAFYTIATISADNIIESLKSMASPEGCGCKSNIASDLAADGVTLMLAGNMGEGAFNKLANAGIRVIRGCHGEINDVLKQYINGEIKDSGTACNHHECNSNNEIRIDICSLKL